MTTTRNQPPTIPKVVLLLESSRASGRGLLRGVAQYAHHHGPWSFYWEPAGLERAWPLLKTLDADGIILRDVEKVSEVLASGIPAVVVGHRRTEIPGLVNVVTDSKAIGQLAAEHLLNCGFRHFGYCGLARSGIERTPWSQQRGESFEHRLSQAGFPTAFFASPAATSKPAKVPWPHERQQLVRWLKSLPKPIGILACNDDRGEQLIEACRAAPFLVPDQVAVLGADNDDLVCGFCNPPLSSVAIGFERAGYESAESLHALMLGRRAAQRKIIATASHVVTRRSTDILAVEDPSVARALRFIRDRKHGPISVSEVSRAAGLSRRSLEKRFRSSLSRSILSEIRRGRVEHIAQLLAETSLSISEIADQLGFDGPQHIARYFRAGKGMTPREFRQRRAPA
jgi:LacI family transcriptional regulator